jgi:quinol monooxygenase YgiN
LIDNDRFGHWNRDERKAKRTKDVKKAVKAILEFVKPYMWQELMMEERSNAQRASSKWKDESDGIQYRFKPEVKEMVEELKNLMEQKVIFKTEAFKNMLQKIPEWEEMQRRKSLPSKFDSMMGHCPSWLVWTLYLRNIRMP